MKFEDYLSGLDLSAIYYVLDNSYNGIMDTDNFNYKDDKLYYKGYLLHREDGPAIEWSDNDCQWYLFGKEYTKNDYIKVIKIKNITKILSET